MDIVLDQARGHSCACDSWGYLTANTRHTEYSITAVAAACIICKSYRCMDVLLFGVRVFIPDGVRCRQQLYGTCCHQSYEGIF